MLGMKEAPGACYRSQTPTVQSSASPIQGSQVERDLSHYSLKTCWEPRTAGDGRRRQLQPVLVQQGPTAVARRQPLNRKGCFPPSHSTLLCKRCKISGGSYRWQQEEHKGWGKATFSTPNSSGRPALCSRVGRTS